MRTEAQPTYGPAVAAVPAAAEAAIPWYRKIFQSLNLAVAMGALALAFSGVLGYLVLQNRNTASDSTISKVTEPRAPFSNSESRSLNAAANTAASSNATVTNSAAAASAPSNTAANSSGRSDVPGGPNVGTDKDLAMGGAPPEVSKPATAAAPVPPVDQPAPVRDDKKAEENKLKTESVDERRKEDVSKSTNDQLSREAQAAAKRSGPNQRSVQNNQQLMENTPNAAGVIASERKAGGKTFVNRNGAWYDRAYSGQATINVSRGSDEFRKLDGGLRSIAESIGGTVVVVWKAKAYRIN